ncbi:MAG TPA: hypothetical protein VGT41_07045 [Candidatus Babeliales bacterium]|nr:hypothetical protein [Candidatus Babeliales bacterium]
MAFTLIDETDQRNILFNAVAYNAPTTTLNYLLHAYIEHNFNVQRMKLNKLTLLETAKIFSDQRTIQDIENYFLAMDPTSEDAVFEPFENGNHAPTKADMKFMQSLLGESKEE